jgi:hypothetical protein
MAQSELLDEPRAGLTIPDVPVIVPASHATMSVEPMALAA